MQEIASQEQMIDAPNGQLFIKSWRPLQPRSEIPLIMLHDSLGCVDLWRGFPEALAKRLGRPVIAYDRLGFGKSDRRDELPSLNFVTEEATLYFPALKAGLGLGTYRLLGHSVGGGMAINIAARDRDCQQVVTIAAQAFVEERTTQGIQAAKELFDQPGQINRLAKYHGDKAGWVLSAWTDVWLSPGFASWGLADVIAQVKVPILAIHGENDEYGSVAFPRFISEQSGGNGEMLLLAECGHVPHREQPEAVLDAVQAFLLE